MATKDITDLQVIRAQQKWAQNQAGPWSYEILAAETGECKKVCFRAIERAAKRGFLNCGVSLRTGWITIKGNQLLKNASAESLNG